MFYVSGQGKIEEGFCGQIGLGKVRINSQTKSFCRTSQSPCTSSISEILEFGAHLWQSILWNLLWEMLGSVRSSPRSFCIWIFYKGGPSTGHSALLGLWLSLLRRQGSEGTAGNPSALGGSPGQTGGLCNLLRGRDGWGKYFYFYRFRGYKCNLVPWIYCIVVKSGLLVQPSPKECSLYSLQKKSLCKKIPALVCLSQHYS